MTATVLAPSTPPAAGRQLEVRAGVTLRNASVLPVLCSLESAPIRSCQVTASALVDGHTVVVGRGSTHLDGRPSAHKVAVPVEFNDLGRELAGRAGLAVVLQAVVQGTDHGSFELSQPHELA